MCGLGCFVIQTFYSGYPVHTEEENTIGQMALLWMFPAAYGRVGSPHTNLSKPWLHLSLPMEFG